MNPLAAFTPDAGLGTFDCMLATAPVVNGNSGLVQVFAPAVATMRNV